ncbi:MAG: alpha/beta hydrolase fold protein [Solirubrobacterales bacterium]|nr:alpha/beta hydrolase fold protein [Solirubrobacterales bacterium]
MTRGGDAIDTGELVLAGVRTRALSVAGAGPPVLLLHGYSDSADTWRLVLAELGARGRAAVAVDLPSHGKADLHRSGPVLPQLRAFAGALVEAHPGGVLVGNSLGGLAALLAAEAPELPLAGVVAIGPAGLGYQRWFLAMRPLILPLMVGARVLPPQAARLLAAQAYAAVAASRRPPAAVLDRYAGHFRDRRRTAALLRMVDRLKVEGLPGCLALERVETPLLLIWGRHDWLVPLTAAALVQQHRADAELVVYEDCGHCVQLEAPERLARELVAFADARVAA